MTDTSLKTEVDRVDVDKLTPYINNAKEHPDKQVKKIASSIKNYGWDQPIVVDEDFEIIKGHGRLEAAKHLGLEKVPVIVRDDLSDAEKKASRLADNRTAESDWDEEALQSEIEELDEQGFDTELTGFDEDELDTFLGDEATDVKEDEPKDLSGEDRETETVKGEKIVMGDHILVCGDSLDEEIREKTHPGGEPDLILTDPPYGIDIVNDNRVGVSGPKAEDKGSIGGGGVVEANTYKPVEGDDTDFDPSFLLDNYDTRIMIFGGNHFTEDLPQRPHWLVWDKKTKEEMDKNNFSDAELVWTNLNKKTTDIYRFMWSGMITEGNQDEDERIHPTQKPVGLLGDILKDYSEEGETVFDPFAGSGSLVIAAEQLERKARVIELDPHYCDLIKERWEDFTGKTAERIKPSESE